MGGRVVVMIALVAGIAGVGCAPAASLKSKAKKSTTLSSTGLGSSASLYPAEESAGQQSYTATSTPQPTVPTQPVTVTPSPVTEPTSSATYSWQQTSPGSCSAENRGQYVVGAWGQCRNTSCSGGMRSRTATCQGAGGLRTATYACIRAGDGSQVAEGYCKSAKPVSQQACAATCAAAAPEQMESCTQGIACRYSLEDQHILSTGCLQQGQIAESTRPSGQSCAAVGDASFVHWGVSAQWAAENPGRCPAGHAGIAQNVYRCSDVCASGKWREESFRIANGDRYFNGATQGVTRFVCVP